METKLTSVCLGLHAFVFLLMRMCLGEECMFITPIENSTLEPCDKTKVPIYIAGLLSISGKGLLAAGMVPAVQVALSDMNNHLSLLTRHEVRVIYGDTQCDQGKGSKILFKLLQDPPTKVAVWESGCSDVNKATAPAAAEFNLLQVSSLSGNPAFSDRKSYPSLFRIQPSTTAVLPAIRDLCFLYQWTRVSILQYKEEVFKLTADNMTESFPPLGIEIITLEPFKYTTEHALGNIKELETRIAVGLFGDAQWKMFLCGIFHQSLYDEKHLWLVSGPFDTWQHDQTFSKCNNRQLKVAFESVIWFTWDNFSDDQDPTISGQTSHQIYDLFKNRSTTETEDILITGPFAYDTVWSMAVALNDTITYLESDNSTKLIQDFSYEDDYIYQLILKFMLAVDIFGATGPIAFNANGDRYGIKLEIEQQLNGSLQTVGAYDTLNNELIWLTPRRITFRGWDPSEPPRDAVKETTELRSVSYELFVALVSLATCGVCYTVVMIAFNIKNRSERVIKLSSPRVNNIIAIGCILCYVSIIFFGIDRNIVSSTSRLGTVCACRAWLLSIGFTLSFGGLFSKTWRVYAIFTSKDKTKRIIIKDGHLYGIMAGFMFVDVIILIAWQVIDPLVPRVMELANEYHPEEDLIVNPRIEGCQSANQYKFLGVIYAYKGLLLLIGAFLAVETRNVKIPELNDSKYIGIAIYNVALLCGIGAPVVGFLEDQKNLAYALVSVFILLATSVSVSIVFLPKMYQLRHNIVDIRSSTAAPNTQISYAGGSILAQGDQPSNAAEYEAQLARLQKVIVTKELEIMKLKQQLKEAEDARLAASSGGQKDKK